MLVGVAFGAFIVGVVFGAVLTVAWREIGAEIEAEQDR